MQPNLVLLRGLSTILASKDALAILVKLQLDDLNLQTRYFRVTIAAMFYTYTAHADHAAETKRGRKNEERGETRR